MTFYVCEFCRIYATTEDKKYYKTTKHGKDHFLCAECYYSMKVVNRDGNTD